MINSHMVSLCANIPGIVTALNNTNCRPILRKNEYRMMLLPVCVLLLITFLVSVYVSTITINTHDETTKKFENQQIMPMSLHRYSTKRYYYSLMPTDRSGGSIREILLAHAFTYQQNRKLQQLMLLEQQEQQIDANDETNNIRIQKDYSKQQNNPLLDEPMIQYGGVCPYSWMPLQQIRTQEKQAMLEKMHLSHVLPIGCPSWMSSSSSPKSSKNPSLIHSDNRRYMSLHNNNVQQSEFLLDDKLYRYDDSELITDDWRQYIHEQRSRLMVKLDENGIQTSSTTRVNNEFKIVVHIRRGDVNPCRYPERYLPNDHYMRLIERYWPSEVQLSSSNYTSPFQTELPTVTMTEKTVRVIIYSESDSYESFDVFHKHNYTVLLDTSDLGAIWNDIIDADVFIMSRSSFSHVPAILNMKGIIIFTPFWEQPLLDDWIVVPFELMNQTEVQISQLRIDACQYQKYRWKSSGPMKYLEKNFDLLINPKPTHKMLKIKQF